MVVKLPDIAQVALKGAKELLLTHFSPRYALGNAIGLDELLSAAQAVFPHTRIAHDLMTYSIPRRI